VLVDDVDESLRAAAFNYVRRLQDLGGDRVLFRDLDTFEFDGKRVPLFNAPEEFELSQVWSLPSPS
jgi:hypothetical protein